jgi:hypothetical protein
MNIKFKKELLQLVLTAEAQVNNSSPFHTFLQLQGRLYVIFFLHICQILTNDARDLDSVNKGISRLSYILCLLKYQGILQLSTFLSHTFQMNIVESANLVVKCFRDPAFVELVFHLCLGL